LHFDLHPNKSDTVLGRAVSDKMVDRLLEAEWASDEPQR
jgi:hypothetical protein